MNKWFYRAVGVASGALLLSGGVANAGAAHESKVDPQTMRGLLADLFTPTGGQHHLGLSIDSPDRFSPRTPTTKDILHTNTMPDLAKALPSRDLLGTEGDRRELLPALGLIGGAAGNGGLLGGLTGGAGGSGLVGQLTGGLTGGLGDGLLGGLTSGGGPLGLVTGLTGSDGPLGGLTSGLTGPGSPLSGITGGLAGTPLGGLFGGAQDDVVDPADQMSDFDAQALRDFLAANNASDLGTDGPMSTDIVDPALRGTALDTTNQRPVVLDPALAKQVNDATAPMISSMIGDALAQRAGVPMSDTPIADQTMADMMAARGMGGRESYEEGLPVVGSLPLVGPLLGPGGPLSQFLIVGDLFNNLPLVGDLTKGNGLDLAAVDRLPVVGSLLNRGLVQSDGPGLPIVGSLPFVGPALNNLTQPLTQAAGGLTGGLGGLTGGTDAGINAAKAPAPVAIPNQAAVAGGSLLGQPPAQVSQGRTAPIPAQMHGNPANANMGNPANRIGIQRSEPVTAGADTVGPDTAGRHRAPTDTTRPTVADNEYEESGSLPLIGDMGALPVSTLVRQIPLINELPLVNTLAAPLSMLKALPVVGMVAGLLPLE